MAWPWRWPLPPRRSGYTASWRVGAGRPARPSRRARLLRPGSWRRGSCRGRSRCQILGGRESGIDRPPWASLCLPVAAPLVNGHCHGPPPRPPGFDLGPGSRPRARVPGRRRRRTRGPDPSSRPGRDGRLLRTGGRARGGQLPRLCIKAGGGGADIHLVSAPAYCDNGCSLRVGKAAGHWRGGHDPIPPAAGQLRTWQPTLPAIHCGRGVQRGDVVTLVGEQRRAPAGSHVGGPPGHGPLERLPDRLRFGSGRGAVPTAGGPPSPPDPAGMLVEDDDPVAAAPLAFAGKDRQDLEQELFDASPG